MSITIAFCSICRRDVHLADGDALACPVCSSPLVETTQTAESPASS